MSDRVTGIAILQSGGANQKLHVLCERSDGRPPLREIIDVYEQGTPKPCEPAWQYIKNGNVLHISPSLHIRVQAHLPESQEWTTWFHNEGQWSVTFLEWPQEDGAWSEFRRVNNLQPE